MRVSAMETEAISKVMYLKQRERNRTGKMEELEDTIHNLRKRVEALEEEVKRKDEQLEEMKIGNRKAKRKERGMEEAVKMEELFNRMEKNLKRMVEEKMESVQNEVKHIRREVEGRKILTDIYNEEPKEQRLKRSGRIIEVPIMGTENMTEQKRTEQKIQDMETGRKTQQEGESWSEVVQRKNKNKNTKNLRVNVYGAEIQGEKIKSPIINMPIQVLEKRVARTAAILIRLEKDSKIKYEDVLREMRKSINLDILKIDHIKTKRSVTGGILIEVAGKDKEEKAKRLAEEINKIVKKDEVYVRCPMKMTEIVVKDIDSSIEKEEVIKEIARIGEIKEEDIRIGTMRTMRSGNNIVWLKVPAKILNKVGKMERLRLGFSDVAIEILENRPIQCFRCWQFGHIATNCKSKKDYTKWCFKCGTDTHIAVKCTSRVSMCKICKENKYPADHRMGSTRCETMRMHKEKGRFGLDGLSQKGNEEKGSPSKVNEDNRTNQVELILTVEDKEVNGIEQDDMDLEEGRERK